jgi:hypothetical protein
MCTFDVDCGVGGSVICEQGMCKDNILHNNKLGFHKFNSADYEELNNF